MANAEKDRVLDQLLENDGTERINSLRHEIFLNIDKYLANVKDPFAKRALNYSYWNLVNYIMKRKLSNIGAKNFFEFTRAEQLAINFGYISERLLEGVEFDQNCFNETLVSTITIEPEIKYFSVTAWLNEQFKEFMGHYEIEKLKAEHETAITKIDAAKKSSEQIMIFKKNFLLVLSKLLNNPQQFAKVFSLSDQIYATSNKYALIKYKVQSGTALSKEERLELINIENTMTQLRNERKEILKSLPRHQMELVDYEEKTIHGEIELLGIISAVGKSKIALEAFIESKNTITLAKKEEFFNERLTLLKTMLELISKRNKIEPTPFLTAGLKAKMPDFVFQAIAKFIEADPKVFANKKVRRFGHPTIIFVPGAGNGVYNYDLNALMIPEFPPKDFRESLISALVLFRWDCDEEREFRDSFNALKPYKRLSFVDLQRSLIRDYIMYITKEREGYKVFDKEIRDWFTWQVAPKKSEEKKINIQQTDGDQQPTEETAPDDNFEASPSFEDAAGDEGGQAPIETSEEPVETNDYETAPAGSAEKHTQSPSESVQFENGGKTVEDALRNFLVTPGAAKQEPPAYSAPVQSAWDYMESRPEAPVAHNFVEEPPAVNFQEPVKIESHASVQSVPVTPEFEKARELIYNKIKSIIKADSVDDKFAITPSDKNDSINIHILNVNVHSTELDLILNTLLIQSKLHKLTDLLKKS